MKRTSFPSHNQHHDDTCLVYAVALQDHFSRTLQIGGSKRLPTQLPGAPLTLAQRVGLIPKPDKLLTQDEWAGVHGLALQRKDPFTSCAICLETFKAEQQVLLSCSHVFHAQCLTSFEAHVRVKACPLCRKQWYQKQTISDAAEAYKHICATRIQAAVKGWLCRKNLALSLQFAPAGPSLKRTWISARLQETCHALTGMVHGAADDLDQLFAELDASLAASRHLGDPIQVRIQAAAAAAATDQSSTASAVQTHQQQPQTLQQRQAGTPEGRQASTGRATQTCRTAVTTNRRQQVAISSLTVHNSREISGSSSSSRFGSRRNERRKADRQVSQTQSTRATFGTVAPGAGDAVDDAGAELHVAVEGSNTCTGPHTDKRPCTATVDWEQVVGKACERGETECAICLGPLAARRETQGMALLSCSHIFHMSCVTSFESFEQGRGGTATCPVCRSAYSRRCFDILEAQ